MDDWESYGLTVVECKRLVAIPHQSPSAASRRHRVLTGGSWRGVDLDRPNTCTCGWQFGGGFFLRDCYYLVACLPLSSCTFSCSHRSSDSSSARISRDVHVCCSIWYVYVTCRDVKYFTCQSWAGVVDFQFLCGFVSGQLHVYRKNVVMYHSLQLCINVLCLLWWCKTIAVISRTRKKWFMYSELC